MGFNKTSLNNLVQYRGAKGQQLLAAETGITESMPNRAENGRVPAVVATEISGRDQSPAEQSMRAAGEITGDVSPASILRDAAPAAASLLSRLVNGGLRAPPHVRLQAAVKVLEGSGYLNQGQQVKQPPGDETRLLALLDRLGKALELRRAAATATDANAIVATKDSDGG